ncbi:hypothetical protein COOONC_10040 [Cooperia oncophora]
MPFVCEKGEILKTTATREKGNSAPTTSRPVYVRAKDCDRRSCWSRSWWRFSSFSPCVGASSHEKGTKTALSGRTSLEPVSNCKGRHQLLIASNFPHISQPKPLSARPPSTPTEILLSPKVLGKHHMVEQLLPVRRRNRTETVRTECSDSLSTDRTYDRLSSMDTSR